MSRALRRHDALIRSAIKKHGGYIFKALGDAFCVAFDKAPDAVAAALEAQRALHAEDFQEIGGLRVRMALDAGDCESREGDYFGPVLNRTSRLIDLAHGEQILISRAAADLIASDLPEGTALKDLGTHRLKGLAQAEHVHQVLAPGLRSIFPALRSELSPPNNLPLQITRFIGRQSEIPAVIDLLQKYRLVTLVGSGGVGKTRLALQVAGEVVPNFPDGIFFVDLAPVRDPQFVPPAVAKSLGLVEMPNVSVTELVAGYLRERRTLLLIDNCEHLIGAAALLANEVLANCKEVRILATSREPLNIVGEHSFRVSSLPEDDAVALFIDRALAVNPDFTVVGATRDKIAGLCRRVDGIALAIELAAARVKALSLEHLHDKLDDRFRLLTFGSRTDLPRHQTMRALIDWSHDLLTPTEQMLFRRLAVFANGWTLPQACAVCRLGMQEWEIVDALSSLVDKSLVVASVGVSGERYKMYESTRDYALERLEAGGEREQLELAHAHCFTAFAQEKDATWERSPTTLWLGEMLPEEDNFRAALSWTLEDARDRENGIRLVSYLPRFWWTGGRQLEGMRWYEAAFSAAEACAAPVSTIARLRYGLAVLNSTVLMRRDARENAERAVELSRGGDDKLLYGWSLLVLGVACALMGDPDAGKRRCAEGLSIANALEATRLRAWLQWAQALNDAAAGLFTEARTELAAQPDVAKRLGDDLLLGLVLIYAGIVEMGAGDGESALKCTKDALELYRRKGDRVGVALAWSNIAPCYLLLQQIDEVRSAAREALQYARDTYNSRLIVIAIEYLAAAAAVAQPERAARLMGYADAWYSRSATPRDLSEREAQRWTTARLQGVLSEESFDGERTSGATLSEADAIEFALS